MSDPFAVKIVATGKDWKSVVAAVTSALSSLKSGVPKAAETAGKGYRLHVKAPANPKGT